MSMYTVPEGSKMMQNFVSC